MANLDRKEVFTEICERLVANDPNFTELEFDSGYFERLSDDDWETFAEAMKQNTTISSLTMWGSLNRVSAEISLADAIRAHPKLKSIAFGRMKFAQFSTIAKAIAQNKNLDSLKMKWCDMPPETKESIGLLLKSNALASLSLRGCDDDLHGNEDSRHASAADLSGALCHNQSLKRLALNSEEHPNVVISPNAEECCCDASSKSGP